MMAGSARALSDVTGRLVASTAIAYQTDERELQELFVQFGSVESARVMRDMATGRARGFAFVEMATDEEAQAAAATLNGHQLGGRTLTGPASPERSLAGSRCLRPSGVAPVRCARRQ